MTIYDLKKGDKFKVESCPNLTFRFIGRDHNGKYQCVATNESLDNKHPFHPDTKIKQVD